MSDSSPGNGTHDLNGALLIDKPRGISSFAVIEALQNAFCEAYGIRKKEAPKLGHGGTLDPFATGLLVVCIERGLKLSRYFLGSDKRYEGAIRFGETSTSGDFTDPVVEKSENLPSSLEVIQKAATDFTLAPYAQIPPMHSAKKKDGKPLYELARQGIEIEREPKICQLHDFAISSYSAPLALFSVCCTSGTYIRVLSQDLSRRLGTVGMLESLRRTASGSFNIRTAQSLDEILKSTRDKTAWSSLSSWVTLKSLGQILPRFEITAIEAKAILDGKQNVFLEIMRRAPTSDPATEEALGLFFGSVLVAAARRGHGPWILERVFIESPLELEGAQA